MRTVKKPVVKKKQAVKKIVTKKKKAASKKYVRKNVKISKELREALKREQGSYCADSNRHNENFPYVYLIGENKLHIAKDFEKLIPISDGCEEMPSITAGEIVNAYIRLAKRKLIPCALCRVGIDFDNSSTWGYDSGNAITKEFDYILSVTESHIVAVTTNGREYDEDGYDEDGNYIEYSNDYDDPCSNLIEYRVEFVK